MDIKEVKLKNNSTKEEVNNIIKDTIELHDEIYLGARHKHNWKCKCGNIIKNRIFADIKSKNATVCGECRYNQVEERYKYEVEKTGEYEYIRSFRKGDILPNGKTVKSTLYMQVKHKHCGSVYEIQCAQFITKHRKCFKCCGSYEKSFAYHIEVELNQQLEKYWSDKNTLNPYLISKSSRNKVWIKCQSGKHDDYIVVCYSFFNNNRCKLCNESKGESEIKIVLDKNNIKYESQKEFEGLVGLGKGNLSYDLYLPKYNLLIEFQGEQHLKYIKGFHKSEKSFITQKEHDRRKMEYSINNGYGKVLEIWYKDFNNIEDILINKLNLNYNNE